MALASVQAKVAFAEASVTVYDLVFAVVCCVTVQVVHSMVLKIGTQLPNLHPSNCNQTPSLELHHAAAIRFCAIMWCLIAVCHAVQAFHLPWRTVRQKHFGTLKYRTRTPMRSYTFTVTCAESRAGDELKLVGSPSSAFSSGRLNPFLRISSSATCSNNIPCPEREQNHAKVYHRGEVGESNYWERSAHSLGDFSGSSTEDCRTTE